MASEKLLRRILTYGGYDLEKSNFNPLLSDTTVGNVSKSLCKVLNDVPSDDDVPLKRTIRKKTVELIGRLCRNKNRQLRDNSETIIKHIYFDADNKQRSKYKYRRRKYDHLHNSIYVLFDSDKYLKDRSLDDNVLELGLALMNFKTPHCRKALNDIVQKCIKIKGELSETQLEFLNRIWEHDNLIINDDLFDSVTFRMKHVLEIKLLKLSASLIENSEIDDIVICDNFKNAFKNHETILTRISKSSQMFHITFSILTDIFIKSNYNDVIQRLISCLYAEVKTRCTNPILLYPTELINVALYCADDPENVMKMKPLYEMIVERIKSLFVSSMFDFVFIMSQHPLWLRHYSEII